MINPTMTFDEAFQNLKSDQPQIMYLGGKTCTGKTTFAKTLEAELGYSILELDKVVEVVIKDLQISFTEKAFLEIYRGHERTDWIKHFLDLAHAEIGSLVMQGRPVVVEGAIAHPQTLQALLAKYQKVTLVYFHPVNVDNYLKNLISRFMMTKQDFTAGLPHGFWQQIDKADFKQFCQDRIITKNLHDSILRYTQLSQTESTQRLKAFKQYFEDILIVEV